ncbi:hypothetical protein ES708_34692 [subsurface metagenome]
MKIILLLLVIFVLFCIFFLPLLLRAYTRNLANQMIYGNRPGTKNQIIRCIRVLTWTNLRLSKDEDPDSQRILKLTKLLEKIQNPHG